MEKARLLNFIRQNIPNIPVTGEGLETISESFEAVNYLKGEYPLKQDKVSDYYYLSEGFVRAFTYDTEGNEITTFF
jgi:hypothetical protein